MNSNNPFILFKNVIKIYCFKINYKLYYSLLDITIFKLL